MGIAAGGVIGGATEGLAASEAISVLGEGLLVLLAPEVILPVLAGVAIAAVIVFAASKIVGKPSAECDETQKDKVKEPDEAPKESPTINPSEVAGKTPDEIDALAKEKGLIPKGPDPKAGKGAYVDPVTGEQRILVHPDADPPHAHVNDPSGQRLDINGNPVSPESPDAHLPIGGQ